MQSEKLAEALRLPYCYLAKKSELEIVLLKAESLPPPPQRWFFGPC